MKINFIFIMIVFFVSLFLGFFGVDVITSLAIIFGIAVVYVFILLTPVVFSNDIARIEKFLKNNQKHPVYLFLYALANKRDADVEESYKAVVSKYKDPSRKAVFQTSYALYKGDLEDANYYVTVIRPPLYQSYYKALILIEAGKYAEARVIAEKIQKKWMKHTLLGEIGKKQGDQEQARSHAQQAFASTRGIQKYSIYKSFEKLLER